MTRGGDVREWLERTFHGLALLPIVATIATAGESEVTLGWIAFALGWEILVVLGMWKLGISPFKRA